MAGCTEIYDVQFVPRARNINVLNVADNAVREALTAPDFSYWLRPENIAQSCSDAAISIPECEIQSFTAQPQAMTRVSDSRIYHTHHKAASMAMDATSPTGGTGEDLLLGVRYISENDFTALESMLSEWTSASSLTDRVEHLQRTLAGGLHQGFTLTRSTVKEDSSCDSLVGGNGRDWYFRNSLGLPSIFRDTITEANLDSVFTEIDTWF